MKIENFSHQYLKSNIGDDYHSFVYRFLYYFIIFSTVKLLLLFKSPKFYKRILDKVFKLKVSLFKQEFTIYFAMLIWIMFLITIFSIIKMQVNLYSKPSSSESLVLRQERLKNKWIIESELWMLTILIIEWM